MIKRNNTFFTHAAALIFTSTNSFAATIDLTSTGFTTGSINQAIFSIASENNGAGTGSIDSFLRIQNNTFEKGYNTDGALEFDQKSGSFTHSLTMGQLQIKNVNGVDYFRFLLDTNQTSNSPLLTLQELELYVNSSTGSDSIYADANSLGVKMWALDNGADNSIELDASVLNNGSGKYDIEALFPVANFGNYNASDFFYLYSEFGQISGQGNAANGEPSNDGFEEWAIETSAAVSQVPLPPAILLLGSSIIGLLTLRRRYSSTEKVNT